MNVFAPRIKRKNNVREAMLKENACFKMVARSEFLDNVVPEQLSVFKSVGDDRMKSASHIAQLVDKGRIVGLATTQFYPEYEELHITFLEVAKGHRGQKLGGRLLEGISDYVADVAYSFEQDFWVTSNGYTIQGERSLQPLISKLNLRHKNVSFYI
jgi:ribosomal protein S18 acetylase RimI-like enzyme